MTPVLRPILAVLAGVATTVGLVVLCTYVAIVTLLETGPEGLPPYSTTTFELVSITYGLVAGLAGGYVAGRWAKANSIRYGSLVGAILYVPIVISRGLPGPGQPVWYPWTFGAIILLGTATGAHLAAQSK